MSRECEDNRWLDILVSVKAQVPLKYFWRIEVVGHSRYSRAQNLENYSTRTTGNFLRLFEGIELRKP